MIAVDTSSLVTYLAGGSGPDVDAVDAAFEAEQVVLPPAVLTEMLSAPDVGDELTDLLQRLPVLDVLGGYWQRSGLLRARLHSQRRRARLADALIAQSCIDHDVLLISRDADFRSFAKVSALKLFS